MPSFNRFGQWCSGVAGSGTYYGHVNPDGSIVGRVLWINSGGTQWFQNRLLCANFWQEPPQRVVVYNTITQESSDVTINGFNNLTTSQNGQWAGWNSINGVLDWLKRSHPISYIDNNSMGPDGSYCIKIDYQSSGGWELLLPDSEMIPITNGNMEQITNLGNSQVVWTVNDGMKSESMNMPSYNPIIFPIWKPKMFKIGNEYWQLYSCSLGCFFHPVNSNLGYRIGNSGNYYGLDAYITESNNVTIIWSLTEGEILSDIRAFNISLNSPRVNLSDGNNQPIPIPFPEKSMRIRAFERPIWQGPYYSFHKSFGDTPISEYKEYGNVITVIGDERDPIVRDTELARILNYGWPMIVDMGEHQPDPIYNNLTVAWLAASDDINKLVNNVNKALGYYEKPVIAYLDNDKWPEGNPFSSDRVWPSIQVYRFANEPIELFKNRTQSVIDRVERYNLPIVLTSRFDDFNGSQSIENILECMPYYEFLLAYYNFVCHMPFADRRGNGIAKIPLMKEWATAFNYASVRPNRFDYWKPSNSSAKNILINKFGQTRANPVLEPYLREDIIRRYL